MKVHEENPRSEEPEKNIESRMLGFRALHKGWARHSRALCKKAGRFRFDDDDDSLEVYWADVSLSR